MKKRRRYFSFFLNTVVNDALYATAVWGGLKIIGHPFSWWALFLFMGAITYAFKDYTLPWKLYNETTDERESRDEERDCREET
jgi:hypothetical protein